MNIPRLFVVISLAVLLIDGIVGCLYEDIGIVVRSLIFGLGVPFLYTLSTVFIRPPALLALWRNDIAVSYTHLTLPTN